MRVTVLGGGYVGLVTAACLAETGNDVVCADLDEAKVARLKANDIPIYEPGLDAASFGRTRRRGGSISRPISPRRSSTARS